MKLEVFPESFLQAMSAANRKSLGQMTASEAQERYTHGQERALKRDVLNWLRLQGAWAFTQPMSKKTRGKLGVPDILVCAYGKFVGIELKAGDSQLAPAQVDECQRIRDAGGLVIVARSLRDVVEGFWKARKGSCLEKENSM